ncbi:hypothetical protein KMW28_04155 [Flammeovirga yaeyamensis]|uniref:Lipoprotein n=1 Tax=Flammeovirga yaeyamensis TaxID=367791 RepID=A0AAX1N6C7_9BACT|nr:hypothetical protein [Flammeovirga yaeyamensis]MBB3697348.1 hypothetical protein [Flammeovirga yaeyamensis]NMF36042.1 hypothetical protein [Flammeovirga yaeyamensis]QWG02777.1 hypothetical protein KMW28_04155 [Flammeovirga yaeyamensis]
MKQTLVYISIIFCMVLQACVPKVCPAYISVFYQKDDPNSLYYVAKTPDPDSDYFLPLGEDSTMEIKGTVSYVGYFINDSTAKEEEIYASREKEWTGLLAPRGGLYGKYFNQDKKHQAGNKPNYIIGSTINPMPEKIEEDSTIDFIAEDSIYLVNSGDSLENLLFGGGPGYDDSMVAKELPDQDSDDIDVVTNDSLPPTMYDGYVYLQKYGDLVAKEDSMRMGYFIVPDSMYLVKRKWYEIWKPKHYMIPKSELDSIHKANVEKYETDSLAKLPQYDSLGNLIEKKKLFGNSNNQQSLETDPFEQNAKEKKKKKDAAVKEEEEDW